MHTLPPIVFTGILWDPREHFPASFPAKCTDSMFTRHPGTFPDASREQLPYFKPRHAEGRGAQLSILKSPQGKLWSKVMEPASNRARTGTQVCVTGSHAVFPLYSQKCYGLRSLRSSFLLPLYLTQALLKISASLDY